MTRMTLNIPAPELAATCACPHNKCLMVSRGHATTCIDYIVCSGTTTMYVRMPGLAFATIPMLGVILNRMLYVG